MFASNRVDNTSSNSVSYISLSNDNYIKELIIKDYEIDFNKDTLEYSITVDSDVDSLDLNIVLSDELISMNIISKDQVEDAHRERIKKAYPAYFDTYKDIDKLIEFINKIDNLYCIGRNGQHRYNNMDHSMVTGMEAANNIITGKTSKENVWNVNTDKEYMK